MAESAYSSDFRLLTAKFTIGTNSTDVHRWLRALAPRATQKMTVTIKEKIEVTRRGDEFHIAAAETDDFEFAAASATETLYRYMHSRALAALPDHVRLRAATGRHRDRAYLVFGPGKSTLAVRLLLAGHDISGDRLALSLDGRAVAMPRRFQIPASVLALLPQLQKATSLASILNAAGPGSVINLDPLDLGLRWRIAPAPVFTIVCIEPNYGGRSRLMPCGKLEMTRRVIAASAAPSSSRQGWIGDIAAVVDRSATFILEVGNPDDAAAALNGVLGRPRARRR